MIQQEVMELIQRSLDHDLSDEEYEKLMELLRNDPESMALYERMKQLSQNLDNLPKVTPPYSIVDSILPQLSQLEGQTHERSMPQRTHRANKRPRLLWGLSSIVAAAVVFGIIIMNGGYFQSTSEQASLMEASESSGSSSMSAGTFMAEADDGAGINDSLSIMSATSSSDAADRSVSFAPSANDEVSISSKNDAELSTSDADDGKVDPLARPIEDDEKELLDTNFVHYEEIVSSPDERFTATIHQSVDRFEVRVTDQNEDVVYIMNETGYIEHFYWSDDSTQFIYTVDDGTNQSTYEVNVDQ